jgi:hypothetical protein
MVRKLQTKEAEEREVELCVNCPMQKSYVPVNGNCYDFELRTDGKPGSGIRLHGEPVDFFYKVIRKCIHALDVSFKPFSKDLKGIVCDY